MIKVTSIDFKPPNLMSSFFSPYHPSFPHSNHSQPRDPPPLIVISFSPRRKTLPFSPQDYPLSLHCNVDFSLSTRGSLTKDLVITSTTNHHHPHSTLKG